MKTYLKIMGYSKKYSFSIVIALIASILFTLFNALAIWMVSSLIGTIMKNILARGGIELKEGI